MRLRGLWVVLSIATFAIVGGAITLSHRQSLAEKERSTPTVSSQDKRADRGAQFESEIIAFEHRLVKGAPLSATLLIEQTPEGSNETRTTTSLIYRDAEGRTRRDQMRGNSTDAPETTTINDPIAGFTYVLRHSDSTARRSTLRPHAEEKSRDSLAVMRNSVAAQQRAGSYEILPVPASPKDLKSKDAPIVSSATSSESLGEREIEGVTAEGTRTVVPIPAGAIGNERALEIVTEHWYSPKLKTVVLIERLDPRFGRSVFRFSGIQRTDPAASLFSVPSNFKIMVE